jgi:hypothetical protein
MEWLLRIRELYCLNRQRLQVQGDPVAFGERDRQLREALTAMAACRDEQLSRKDLHPACRKTLQSLTEHWQGLTVFVDHPEVRVLPTTMSGTAALLATSPTRGRLLEAQRRLSGLTLLRLAAKKLLPQTPHLGLQFPILLLEPGHAIQRPLMHRPPILRIAVMPMAFGLLLRDFLAQLLHFTPQRLHFRTERRYNRRLSPNRPQDSCQLI